MSTGTTNVFSVRRTPTLMAILVSSVIFSCWYSFHFSVHVYLAIKSPAQLHYRPKCAFISTHSTISRLLILFLVHGLHFHIDVTLGRGVWEIIYIIWLYVPVIIVACSATFGGIIVS